MTNVYLQIDQNVKVTSERICLREIARIHCQDKALETKIKLLKLPAANVQGPGRYVFSAMDVIEVIQREYPSVEVNNLGETDFIITLERMKAPNAFWQWMKTAFVCLLSFFGAAFSIMAFHTDVDIRELFGQLYELFTGEASGGVTILEVSYSIGLGLGIVLFFNHFAKRKLTADPTPLEMELRAYEDQVNTTLIEAEGRAPQKKEADR